MRSSLTIRFSKTRESSRCEGRKILGSHRRASHLNLTVHRGGKGIRTPDPRLAKAMLYQLSYSPDGCNSAGAQRTGASREKSGGPGKI